jgi:hypothetical protein
MQTIAPSQQMGDALPFFPKDLVLAEVRVILRSPPYSMNGWAKDSRGSSVNHLQNVLKCT